jgi:hypothetical protein
MVPAQQTSAVVGTVAIYSHLESFFLGLDFNMLGKEFLQRAGDKMLLVAAWGIPFIPADEGSR